MSRKEDGPKQASLMGLPVELRLNIYKHVMPDMPFLKLVTLNQRTRPSTIGTVQKLISGDVIRISRDIRKAVRKYGIEEVIARLETRWHGDSDRTWSVGIQEDLSSYHSEPYYPLRKDLEPCSAALLATCRQLYYEASPFLFKRPFEAEFCSHGVEIRFGDSVESLIFDVTTFEFNHTAHRPLLNRVQKLELRLDQAGCGCTMSFKRCDEPDDFCRHQFLGMMYALVPVLERMSELSEVVIKFEVDDESMPTAIENINVMYGMTCAEVLRPFKGALSVSPERISTQVIYQRGSVKRFPEDAVRAHFTAWTRANLPSGNLRPNLAQISTTAGLPSLRARFYDAISTAVKCNVQDYGPMGEDEAILTRSAFLQLSMEAAYNEDLSAFSDLTSILKQSCEARFIQYLQEVRDSFTNGAMPADRRLEMWLRT